VAHAERLLQHEARLRLRTLLGVDEQEHAVDHAEHALDLAAKVCVTRRVDNVDLGALPRQRCILRQNGDATLALLVVAVHHAIILAERLDGVGRLQHGIDQGGFAVVDVRHDGNIAQVLPHGAQTNGASTSGGAARRGSQR